MLQIHQGISELVAALVGHVGNVDLSGSQYSGDLTNHVRNIHM